MAARVLHLGEDDCHRVSILESAGYGVEPCVSLEQLQADLQTGSNHEAIFVTECESVSAADAAAVARSYSQAPLILFRTSNRRPPEEEFDLVVDSLEAPEQWLHEVRMLIEKSRKLPARSADVTPDSRQLRG